MSTSDLDNKVIDITEETFDSVVLHSKVPVLLDFWAEWCGPCRSASHVLTNIASKRSDILIAKLNIEKNSNLAVKYKIQSIPAFMIFKNGEIASSRVGMPSQSDFEKWIDESL